MEGKQLYHLQTKRKPFISGTVARLHMTIKLGEVSKGKTAEKLRKKQVNSANLKFLEREINNTTHRVVSVRNRCIPTERQPLIGEF
jgi:hypothetical protein